MFFKVYSVKAHTIACILAFSSSTSTIVMKKTILNVAPSLQKRKKTHRKHYPETTILIQHPFQSTSLEVFYFGYNVLKNSNVEEPSKKIFMVETAPTAVEINN